MENQKNYKALLILITMFLLNSLSLMAQPTPVWTSTYNGQNNGNDRAHKLTVDGNGNIYVLGTTYNAQTKNDIVLTKYNSSGTQIWQKFYYGDVDADDTPIDLDLDAQGNIYIAVNNFDFSSRNRAVVLKYSSSGTLLWKRHFEGDHLFFNELNRTVNCLKVVSDGTFYVAGRWSLADGMGSVFGLSAYKGNSTGAVVDSSLVVFGSDYDSNAATNYYDITTDNSGNVYAVGSRNNNIYLKKFNQNFDSVLVKSYNGAGNGVDAGLKVIVDNNFYTYIGGYVSGGVNGKDFVVIKYDNGGTQLWARTYNGPANGEDILSDFIVAGDGSIYMTGKVSGGSSGYDIGTSRITSAGAITWTNLYNGNGNGNDFGINIALDNSGALYVAGTSNEGTNGTDYIVIKYSTLFANQHWAAKFSLSTADTLTSMVLDNNFNVYVCGHHKRFLNNDRDMALYKLGSTIGIQSLGNEIPEKFELSQNYPNPFNPTTNINFSIPKAGNVKLVVFDVNGKQVAELVNEQLNAGVYKFDFNASGLSSGVYFYKLVTNEFTEVKKMMLVK